MRDLQPSARFDLHLHSTRSDGRFSPLEVLERCSRAGLDIVALTDHDFATEIPVGEQIVAGRRLHVLAGAEISGVHEGREYHLLVYFPHGIPEGFRDFCRRQCQERAVRYERALTALDLSGPFPDDGAKAGDRALTRLHLAHALVDAGVVRDRAQAFTDFLGDAHGTVQPLSLPFVEAIRIARSCGGLTSWAHPARPAMEAHLETFVAAGLQGIEGVRPMLTSKDRRFYRTTARRHGLYLTGGSDWHGWHSDAPGLFRVHAVEIRDFVDALLAA
ncbi:MAG: PHP domain-containing protein [Myxococcota bacterium]